MPVSFRLLGDIEAWIDDRPVELGHARQRSVLAVLLIDANHTVSVDKLVERIWAERAPQRVRGALYTYISRLRQALAGASDVAIKRQSGGYVLTVDPAAVDLHRFQRLVRRARSAAEDEDRCDLLDEALRLWPGGGLRRPRLSVAEWRA
jgi:DNA-binding SARP family transcriptional activator